VKGRREPFDAHVRRALEPTIRRRFDWEQLRNTPIPSMETRVLARRRRAERIVPPSAGDEDALEATAEAPTPEPAGSDSAPQILAEAPAAAPETSERLEAVDASEAASPSRWGGKERSPGADGGAGAASAVLRASHLFQPADPDRIIRAPSIDATRAEDGLSTAPTTSTGAGPRWCEFADTAARRGYNLPMSLQKNGFWSAGLLVVLTRSLGAGSAQPQGTQNPNSSSGRPRHHGRAGP